MSSLIFYNSYDIFDNPHNKQKLSNIPGGEAFSSYFQIFSQNITCVDRTNTIKIPLNVKVPDYLKMPEYQKFDKSFEEICDERAKFLLQFAEWKNRKIAVMYSGGVDSTLILCSFLKNATEKQLKNILVLMSDESIRENRNFYYDYVSKHFDCISTYRFPYFLGHDDYLLLSGENADQLFGSQVNDLLTKKMPYSNLFLPFEQMEGKVLDYFAERLKIEGNEKYAEGMLTLFKKIVDAAPIELNNVYRFFWWINFTTKWQSVYTRILPHTIKRDTLQLEENYTTFFRTDEFQLWALNNTDVFSLDVDNCGKKIAKQYIYEVNGDPSYLKKPKVGSLAHIVKRKEVIYTIDENLKFSNDYPTEEYYNHNNDFIEMMK